MGESLVAAEAIDRDGFAVLRGVYDEYELDRLTEILTSALQREMGEAVRRSEEGHVFAARNLLQIWPDSRVCWRRPRILAALADVLGAHFGLVRGLFFDKPPGRTWSLPWHKDVTIAVRDNSIVGLHFSKPTHKCGVPHIEAPIIVLNQMLTLRIHLDPATKENGALVVIPGSHNQGKTMRDEQAAVTVEANRGDVLLIRPLVSHCSASSDPATTLHRRIIHVEFAAERQLPNGYEWFIFER
ncbi:MAG: phytanoyl-CoA dioxygenase family protein [Gemmataceae bacterium]